MRLLMIKSPNPATTLASPRKLEKVHFANEISKLIFQSNVILYGSDTWFTNHEQFIQPFWHIYFSLHFWFPLKKWIGWNYFDFLANHKNLDFIVMKFKLRKQARKVILPLVQTAIHVYRFGSWFEITAQFWHCVKGLLSCVCVCIRWCELAPQCHSRDFSISFCLQTSATSFVWHVC